MNYDATGPTSGKPPIDPQILAQLKSLGLKPQGSREADLAAIQAAKLNQSESQGSNGKNIFNSILDEKVFQKGPMQPLPWAGIMDELRISPSGSKEVDIANISTAITSMDLWKAALITAKCQALGLSV